MTESGRGSHAVLRPVPREKENDDESNVLKAAALIADAETGEELDGQKAALLALTDGMDTDTLDYLSDMWFSRFKELMKESDDESRGPERAANNPTA